MHLVDSLRQLRNFWVESSVQAVQQTTLIMISLRLVQEYFTRMYMIISLNFSFINWLFARYLPTKNNRKIWKLEREIHSLILKVVKEHKEESIATSEKVLLQCILEGANASQIRSDLADSFVVDNCKNIYFAGHETTAVTATWSLMLLALNPGWQARVRDEVAEVCGGELPDADKIRKMKTVCIITSSLSSSSFSSLTPIIIIIIIIVVLVIVLLIL